MSNNQLSPEYQTLLCTMLEQYTAQELETETEIPAETILAASRGEELGMSDLKDVKGMIHEYNQE